jgi:hypothetical protein
VVVTPDQAETGAVTLTLSQPVGGTLTLDGQASTVEIGRTGQYARLTFAATKDQRITLGASRVTIGASGPNGAYVSILDPDGKPVVDRAWVGRDGESIAAGPLRVAGTYAVMVTPDRTDTGSITLTLSQPVTGTIVADGQPVSVNIERPGQHARLTFEGQRGQTLTLTATRITLGTGSSASVYLSVLDPDGKPLVNQEWVGRNGGEVKVPALPTNGTYTVLVEPDRTDTGGVSVALK